jgi:peptide chain release factor 2/peptide chain release factor
MTYLLQISSGTGPAEVRAFVALLARRLTALCLSRGLLVREVKTAGDPEAPRSVELLLEGAPEALPREELGTHALISRSAARGRDSRKRWFAGVSLAEASRAAGASLAARDLTITAARGGGPGGQRVNKVATAVRVVHRPTGLSVRAAAERSQRQNKRAALGRLAAELTRRAEEARAAAEAARRGGHYRVLRGAPVRTYRLDRDGGLSPEE